MMDIERSSSRSPELRHCRRWVLRRMMTVCVILICDSSQHMMINGDTNCDRAKLEGIVSREVALAVQQDPRMAASLLRLHFHDCFVHGCDASVLLDGKDGEKVAFPNLSLRGFKVIDGIKGQIVQACGNILSCADILAMAANTAVQLAKGPCWKVKLGRLDSTASYRSLANTTLPSPSASLDVITQKYANVGLTSITDVVALSGAHTFGRAACISFSNRLYNFNGTGMPDPTVNQDYLQVLQDLCPQGGNQSVVVNLDKETPDQFDNFYFINLKLGHGLLSSDQELYANSSSSLQEIVNKLVQMYARDKNQFFKDFATSMEKMSNIAPPNDGSNGEVRLNCSVVNTI